MIFFFNFFILLLCSFRCYHLFSHETRPWPESTEQFNCRDEVFITHLFRAAHKQWEVAILILMNISKSIKFCIGEMDS